VQEAISLWADGDPVPGTDGQTLDLATVQEIIALWSDGEPV
jgi:hypothetical protein